MITPESMEVHTIMRCIENGYSFRIGARGICIDCLRVKRSMSWSVSIARAGMQSLNCDCIAYDPEDNTLVCSVECGYVCAFQFDMNMYDKVTVIE